jgi:hypothetical protein
MRLADRSSRRAWWRFRLLSAGSALLVVRCASAGLGRGGLEDSDRGGVAGRVSRSAPAVSGLAVPLPARGGPYAVLAAADGEVLAGGQGVLVLIDAATLAVRRTVLSDGTIRAAHRVHGGWVLSTSARGWLTSDVLLGQPLDPRLGYLPDGATDVQWRKLSWYCLGIADGDGTDRLWCCAPARQALVEVGMDGGEDRVVPLPVYPMLVSPWPGGGLLVAGVRRFVSAGVWAPGLVWVHPGTGQVVAATGLPEDAIFRALSVHPSRPVAVVTGAPPDLCRLAEFGADGAMLAPELGTVGDADWAGWSDGGRFGLTVAETEDGRAAASLPQITLGGLADSPTPWKGRHRSVVGVWDAGFGKRWFAASFPTGGKDPRYVALDDERHSLFVVLHDSDLLVRVGVADLIRQAQAAGGGAAGQAR